MKEKEKEKENIEKDKQYFSHPNCPLTDCLTLCIPRRITYILQVINLDHLHQLSNKSIYLSYKPSSSSFFLFYLTTFSKQQNQIIYFKLYLIKISIFIISSPFITIKIRMGLKGIIYHPLIYCLHLTKSKEINKKQKD